MNVIAKMNCTAVEDYGFNRKILFRAVHDGGINIGENPENRAFTNATPNGEAWMTVDNKFVWPAFEPNKSQHYVVFIDAKEHSLDDVHRALATLDQ
jgi:hypothetical protein